MLVGFVFDAFWLFFVETLNDVISVRNGDDAVELLQFPDLFVDKESLDDWIWVSKSGGLNDDSVERFNLVIELLESLDQVTADGAANVAIHNFNDFFIDVLRQDIFINTDFPELVFDASEFHLVRVILQSAVLPEPRNPVKTVTGMIGAFPFFHIPFLWLRFIG